MRLSIDGRIVFAPRLGETQLHLGASAHFRDTGDVAGLGARYRQRPLVHTTDVRFLATPSLDVESETITGSKPRLIRGPVPCRRRGALVRSRSRRRASARLLRRLCRSRLVPDRREPRLSRRPLGPDHCPPPGRRRRQCGAGAFQVNLRYDHLDLNSGPVRGGTPERAAGKPGLDPAGLCPLPADLRPSDLRRGRDSGRRAATATIASTWSAPAPRSISGPLPGPVMRLSPYHHREGPQVLAATRVARQAGAAKGGAIEQDIPDIGGGGARARRLR